MNVNHNETLMIEVGEKDFESTVLRSKRPILVLFWANWSRPCQILALTLGEVAASCREQVAFVKINADDNPDLSLSLGIQSIPTLLYLIDGRLCARVVGTATKEAIVSKLKSICRDSA